AEASNATQKQDEEIARLKKEFEDHRKAVPQDFVAKDPEIESLTAKLSTAESKIKEKTLRVELDRKAFTRLQAGSKGQISQFTQQIKDLEASIVTKDTHSQQLETAIQVLETGKAWLKEAMATAEKKFGNQNSAQTVDILNLKQKYCFQGFALTRPRICHSSFRTEKANLKATMEAAQKEFEERIADKDLHAHMLNNMIQSLEMEKRKLEQNSALEKPQIEADHAALKKLKESTEAGTAQLPVKTSKFNNIYLPGRKPAIPKPTIVDGHKEFDINCIMDSWRHGQGWQFLVRWVDQALRTIGFHTALYMNVQCWMIGPISGFSSIEYSPVSDISLLPSLSLNHSQFLVFGSSIYRSKSTERVNELQNNLATKDSLIELLNTNIDKLKTEKSQLKATAVADK
ncbi:hypothetical protein EV368DRAFT_70404, partial [Lentinula lateritia]